MIGCHFRARTEAIAHTWKNNRVNEKRERAAAALSGGNGASNGNTGLMTCIFYTSSDDSVGSVEKRTTTPMPRATTSW
jgi:hypothetical protein